MVASISHRVILLLAILTSQLVSGEVLDMTKTGGDVSGGGALANYLSNPWFLRNTPMVSYCLEIDAIHFSQSPKRTAELLKEALDYWKRELRKGMFSEGGDSTTIGSQEFIQKSCQEDVDLRFQFGILSEEQKNTIGDPTHFAGVTVRTSFDAVNLRSQGFIYISADSGPLSLQGVDLVDRPWAQGEGGLLHKVLVHELGHVFGIPHSGMNNQLMGAGFPEVILKKSYARQFAKIDFVPDFAVFTRGPWTIDEANPYRFCDLKIDSQLAAFLSIPSSWRCLSFHYIHDGMGASNRLVFQASKDRVSALREVGIFEVKGTSIKSIGPMMTVRLPPSQKIYQASGVLNGNMYTSETITGKYWPTGSSSYRNALIILEPNHLRIIGGLGEDIHLLLDIESNLIK